MKKMWNELYLPVDPSKQARQLDKLQSCGLTCTAAWEGRRKESFDRSEILIKRVNGAAKQAGLDLLTGPTWSPQRGSPSPIVSRLIVLDPQALPTPSNLFPSRWRRTGEQTGLETKQHEASDVGGLPSPASIEFLSFAASVDGLQLSFSGSAGANTIILFL